MNDVQVSGAGGAQARRAGKETAQSVGQNFASGLRSILAGRGKFRGWQKQSRSFCLSAVKYFKDKKLFYFENTRKKRKKKRQEAFWGGKYFIGKACRLFFPLLLVSFRCVFHAAGQDKEMYE